MRERLQKRNTDTEAVIETRIKNSVHEIDQLLEWKEKVNYRIFNDDLATSQHTLLTLLKALYFEELGV